MSALCEQVIDCKQCEEHDETHYTLCASTATTTRLSPSSETDDAGRWYATPHDVIHLCERHGLEWDEREGALLRLLTGETT